MKLGVLSVFLFTFACSPQPSQLQYDDTATECPAADLTNRYIEVPLFHNLEENGAALENLPELNTHAELATNERLSQMKIDVYYELYAEFDPAKELLIVIPGGPGSDHQVVHSLQPRIPALYEKYNVIAMDHRGLGCSRPTWPIGGFTEPHQFHFMRYAASDIELIRKELVGDEGVIHVWGGSYGTMLAQTYALLYPQHLGNLMLAGAFSASQDFSMAQARFESLAMSSVPGVMERYLALKDAQPELARAFLQWSVGPMYGYEGRTVTIPEKLAEIENELISGDESILDRILEENEGYRFVMSPMTRAIFCMEIFRHEPLFENEVMMFPYNTVSCREFPDEMLEYFDYTDALRNVAARTLLVAGAYDHVTPLEAMMTMSDRLPNDYLHVDRHLGHDAIRRKKECIDPLYSAFIDGADDDTLRRLSATPACLNPPTSPDGDG